MSQTVSKRNCTSIVCSSGWHYQFIGWMSYSCLCRQCSDSQTLPPIGTWPQRVRCLSGETNNMLNFYPNTFIDCPGRVRVPGKSLTNLASLRNDLLTCSSHDLSITMDVLVEEENIFTPVRLTCELTLTACLWGPENISVNILSIINED